MNRPWAKFRIDECGESLKSLPEKIFCIEPHPYMSIGAPYGKGANPWRLRSGLIPRLIIAQNNLQKEFPDFRLAVFDAWRPIKVQSFMVNYSIAEECKRRGLNNLGLEEQEEIESIRKNVFRFWAPPSLDPLTPPPHSTGGAIDLTLYHVNGNEIDMGGNIDEISEISSPTYYENEVVLNTFPRARLFNERRMLLAKVMTSVGFVQHPNEWWHFSYGDQLWAWKKHSLFAIYGGVDFI